MASKGYEFISPVGRMVQGSLSLEGKEDMTTKKPKVDEDGNPIKECFIALAIRKDDPGLGPFWASLQAAARAEFPHLFDANGNCTHPKFAWKVQDGDGVDTNGQSVADKEGFAGCYVFKFATRYMPKCYHEGRFDATQMLTDPASIIKRGYYIRIAGRFSGNGVGPQDRQNVPGMFLSPDLVSLVGYGPEIVGGPDAAKTFGATPAPALPPGASAIPTAGGAPAGIPALPGAAVAGIPALPGAGGAPAGIPSLPGAAAAVPSLPSLAVPNVPGVPVVPAVPAAQGPQWTMTALAQGASFEALVAKGWTPELIQQHGLAVKNW